MRHSGRERVPGYVVIALFAAAALPLGCAGDGGATETLELSGYVTEEQSGKALDGVRVTFTSDTLFTATSRTDSDGFYEMAVETDIRFGQLRAEHDGHFTRERTVYFDANQRRVDLALRRQ